MKEKSANRLGLKTIEYKAWSLKKKNKDKFRPSGVNEMVIEIVNAISATEHIGYIKLPKIEQSGYGYATVEWVKHHPDLGKPSEALIASNGDIFWEVIDIKEAENNRILIFLKKL